MTIDVVGRYDTLPEIKKNYSRLTEEYRGLVYNALELETIEEKYQLQTALVFSEGGGGWAVSVKEDAKESLSEDIVIPSEYQGQLVTAIPEGAFSGCAGIRSITVPDSVTSIGKGAFSGCIGLQSITLPFVGESQNETASRIEYGNPWHFGYIFGRDSYSGGMMIKQVYDKYDHYAEYCIPNQLIEVTITNAVQLSFGAFSGCSMLETINLNSGIIGGGGSVFKNCTGIKMVNIPDLLVISENMFEGCSSLETLTLSDSVMRIEEDAFKGCINLSKLNSETEGDFVIGNSVQYIGKGAFNGCLRMQFITLPFIGESQSEIASRIQYGNPWHFGYIFGRDSYSGGMMIEQIYDQYGHASDYCIPNQLKEVTITNAMQVSFGAFSNCSMLDKLTINSDAKSNVSDKAFEGCVKPTWN